MFSVPPTTHDYVYTATHLSPSQRHKTIASILTYRQEYFLGDPLKNIFRRSLKKCIESPNFLGDLLKIFPIMHVLSLDEPPTQREHSNILWHFNA